MKSPPEAAEEAPVPKSASASSPEDVLQAERKSVPAKANRQMEMRGCVECCDILILSSALFSLNLLGRVLKERKQVGTIMGSA
jgi:hypothetical protein